MTGPRTVGAPWRPAIRVALAATVLALASLAVVAGPGAGPVRAADPVFGEPTIDATFGQGVKLTQPVKLDETPARVEVLLTYADPDRALVVELPPPTAIGSITLRHQISVGTDGHIYPNTPISARWRITPDDGDPVLGPAGATVYADERFDWQTVRGDIVRVHWYEGGAEFGARALRIGEDAVAKTAELLGVTENEPIDFFIYAGREAFYDALGPGTRENVGGQANADIRTLFALVGASDVGWDEIVVRHELVHLVFDTAVQNPYHFPPRWLNEGLAVYLSQGYDANDRGMVEAAGRAGELVPLDGLAGQFPTTAEGFFLAYAESVSAVDFFIRTHDQDALVALIGSYANGLTDDEAFEAAIGMDVAAFNAAWLADLGAVVPVRHGPQPAPAGPRPSAWGAPGAGPGATTPPGAGAPITTPVPGNGQGTGGPASGDTMLPLILITVVVFGAALLLVWSRSRRASASPPGP